MSEKLKKIRLNLRDGTDLSEFEIFIGCHLAIESNGDVKSIERLKKSIRFTERVRQDLLKFGRKREHSFENLSQHFCRSLACFEKIQVRGQKITGKILTYPKFFKDAIFFEKKNESSRYNSGQYFLLCNVALSKCSGCFGETISVSTFTDALCFFDISVSYETFNMKSLRFVIILNIIKIFFFSWLVR